MRIIKVAALFLLMIMGANLSAQQNTYSEKYGNTLNLGLGLGGYSGYYGYIGRSLPVFHINYEFGVAQNFTLAPFATFFTYSEPYYRETVIPIGVKGKYYFDQMLNASADWDFYLAGSLGFALVNTSWDNSYTGDRTYYRSASNLFLDAHIGAEYHLNRKLGIFLDLSTGVSTIGLAFH
jgi:hypothetical protein